MAYFNALDNLTETEQIIINKGKEEISLYDDKISFSNEVKNLVSKLVYDERKASYEVQLEEVISIIKEA